MTHEQMIFRWAGIVLIPVTLLYMMFMNKRSVMPGYLPFKRKVGKGEPSRRLLLLAKHNFNVNKLPFTYLHTLLHKALYVDINEHVIKMYSYVGLHSYDDQPALYYKSIIDNKPQPLAWYYHGKQTHSWICGKKEIDDGLSRKHGYD